MVFCHSENVLELLNQVLRILGESRPDLGYGFSQGRDAIPAFCTRVQNHSICQQSTVFLIGREEDGEDFRIGREVEVAIWYDPGGAAKCVSRKWARDCAEMMSFMVTNGQRVN